MAPIASKLCEWREKNPEKARVLNKKHNKTYREKNKSNEVFKNKEALRQKKYYQQKKLSKIQEVTEDGESGYSSRNCLLKNVRKIQEKLPNEREKRKEIVKELAKEFNFFSPPQQPKSRSSCRQISESAKLAIDFFESGEHFVTLPGKNDTISIGKGATKQKVQKRIFTRSVNEMYEIFKEENPNSKLGPTRFRQLIPKSILSFTKMPTFSCLCKIHQNFKMAFLGAKKNLINKNLSTYREFSEVKLIKFI